MCSLVFSRKDRNHKNPPRVEKPFIYFQPINFTIKYITTVKKVNIHLFIKLGSLKLINYIKYYIFLYQASLAKDAPKEESAIDVADESKDTEAIEIKDVEDADDSDNESVVEVVEPEKEPESVEVIINCFTFAKL